MYYANVTSIYFTDISRLSSIAALRGQRSHSEETAETHVGKFEGSHQFRSEEVSC